MSASDLYLSPDQQDLLMAALTSNQSSSAQKSNRTAAPTRNAQRSESLSFTPGSTSDQTAPGSGHLDFSDDSPFLDFTADGDFDDSFNYDEHGQMIGDLPDDPNTHDLHEKRKSIDGQDEDDEGGGKRREGDDKTAKKPGRKPLTSEPTNKRKAQNRAAQRAFRERKERHLKDLETKVEDLEKTSEAANHENGLLKAQVEKLQVELREYRKRLSWITNGVTRSNSVNSQPHRNSLNSNDFQFEFPKFGDLPSANFVSTNAAPQAQNTQRKSTDQAFSSNSPVQSSVGRRSMTNMGSQSGSIQNSPASNVFTASPPMMQQNSMDSLTGLFSPSILQATKNSPLGYFQDQSRQKSTSQRPSVDNTYGQAPGLTSNSSNTDSPGSSSDSQQHMSSIGTSPETLFNSPGPKQDFNVNTFDTSGQVHGTFGKDDLCGCIQQACGDCNDPVPPILSKSNIELLGQEPFTTDLSNNAEFDWLAQQNGGSFDPVLFGDYRETQDNILSQDFGSFFNDAYPLPDLGSPLHNFDDVTAQNAQQATRNDLIKKVDAAKNGEEVVPADKGNMLTCNKIWDRLQQMEKFRNGEIDIDNLCSELRSKAKCSEGGAVVDEKHVNKILGA